MSADIEAWPPPNDPDAFESMCLDLWKEIWKDPGAQKNGRSGQPQAGVDVFGKHDGQWVGVQCKQKDGLLRKKVTPKELEDEVKAARNFKPPLAAFILATTGARDEKVQERARELSDEHKSKGLFKVEVWSWSDIWHELYQREELLKRIAPNYWPRLAAMHWDERTPADVTMTVSVTTESNQLQPAKDTALCYTLTRLDAEIRIEPSMSYLSKYLNGGPIEPTRYDWVPFEWDFPELDVRVLNNSKRTVFFTEAILRVEESHLDPKPVLVIKPDAQRRNALHIFISNEGWGEVRGLRVNFHLTAFPDGRLEPVFTEPYPYKADIGDFLDSVNVCVADALRDAGVDLDGLASLNLNGRSGKRGALCHPTKLDTHTNESTLSGDQWLAKMNACLGSFRNGGALVSGELVFNALTEEGTTKETRVKFSTRVWLYNANLLGLPLPPTYHYTTKFEVNGTNYERRIPLSQALKPGEADRFNIKIGMDKSSRHFFRLRLADNEGYELESPAIQLMAFVPRAGTKCEAQTPRPVSSQDDWPFLGWTTEECAALTRPLSSGPLTIWKEKLEYLREQETITADPAQKFELKKQIEEAELKIRELGA